MICAEHRFLRHIQQTKNHDSCTVVTLTISRADCILGIDSSASIFSDVWCSKINFLARVQTTPDFTSRQWTCSLGVWRCGWRVVRSTYCGFSQKFLTTPCLVTIWRCLSTCSFLGWRVRYCQCNPIFNHKFRLWALAGLWIKLISAFAIKFLWFGK